MDAATPPPARPRIEGPGWMRVADLPRDTMAHPKAAPEHGIRA
ncbi:hypothetical protein SAMN04487848_1205 [Microbacterium sp. ru370.1]|nr:MULTISPECIES: hypothetical protein [unclassified Microbacterium]SDO50386.1 hypothetical protein SAMN04487848_1205 [Microbacterium sp. ru370.1]SIT83092.1 hypothetical protein SAMN05880579_1201 [Microbacterium sp. RU1D]